MTDFLADAGFDQTNSPRCASAPATRSRAKTVVLHDKFYTPHDVASRCVARVMEVVGLRPDDLYIEPSAGAGAFCAHLPGDRLMAMDIAPEAPGIETQDFLTFQFPAHDGRSIVIGNPPFGQNGTLARAFLRKAMQHADIVAYILPASYAKTSMQRGINRSFHLVHEELLPAQPFKTHLGDRIVNTVFQIWQRQAVPRDIAPVTIGETDFAFTKDLTQADLVIRRTGARAGVILPVPDLNTDGAPPRGYAKSSNYYIRSISCDPTTLATRIETLGLRTLAAENGIMPSLPKPALIAAYDKAWCAKDLLCPASEACALEAGMRAAERPGAQSDIWLKAVGTPDQVPDVTRLNDVGDYAANALSYSGRPRNRIYQGQLLKEFTDWREADGSGEDGCADEASAPLQSPGIVSQPQQPRMSTLPQRRHPSPALRDLVPPSRAIGRIWSKSSGGRRTDPRAVNGHTPPQHLRSKVWARAGGSARGPPAPGCRTGGWGVIPARASARSKLVARFRAQRRNVSHERGRHPHLRPLPDPCRPSQSTTVREVALSASHDPVRPVGPSVFSEARLAASGGF